MNYPKWDDTHIGADYFEGKGISVYCSKTGDYVCSMPQNTPDNLVEQIYKLIHSSYLRGFCDGELHKTCSIAREVLGITLDPDRRTF